VSLGKPRESKFGDVPPKNETSGRTKYKDDPGTKSTDDPGTKSTPNW